MVIMSSSRLSSDPTGVAASRLPPEVLSEFRECFGLFDRDRDSAISVDEVPIVLRSLGLNVTESQVKDIKQCMAWTVRRLCLLLYCQL